MKLKLYFGLLVILLFFACNKDDVEPPTSVDVRLEITKSTWTGYEEFFSTTIDGDFEKFTPVCNDDDPWLFNTDDTYSVSEGMILCDPDQSPLEFTGSYLLDETNMTLHLDPMDFGDMYDIVLIKSDSFLIELQNANNSRNRILLTR